MTATVVGAAAAASMNLIGSAASFFDSMVLYSNNTPVETVNQYGLLANYLLNNTVDFSDRSGGVSVVCVWAQILIQ